MSEETQTSPADKFIDWLKSQYKYALVIELIDDDRWVMVERLMYHYTIKWGVVGDFSNGYEDRWCIADKERAIKSFETWKQNNFEGEPTLWRRHPATGRRRNDDGDPDSEYIFH